MSVPAAVRLTIVILTPRHAWDTLDMDDNESGRPRRQTPTDVANRRAAKQLVAPLQDQLGLWQAESVKFETMAERARLTGRGDEQLSSEIRDLLEAVTRQAIALDGAAAEAPESVRMHSRVTDVRRVLTMLEQRLTETLNGLDRPTKR